jgi:hypothetical protein
VFENHCIDRGAASPAATYTDVRLTSEASSDKTSNFGELKQYLAVLIIGADGSNRKPGRTGPEIMERLRPVREKLNPHRRQSSTAQTSTE